MRPEEPVQCVNAQIIPNDAHACKDIKSNVISHKGYDNEKYEKRQQDHRQGKNKIFRYFREILHIRCKDLYLCYYGMDHGFIK
jgi:hypothetical protein